MIPWLTVSCGTEPELDPVAAPLALPGSCEGPSLVALPREPTLHGAHGWTAAPGQVVAPDGTIHPVPGVPVTLVDDEDRALVALGEAGGFEVTAHGARPGAEGDVVDVAMSPEGDWYADATGRVSLRTGSSSQTLTLPGWPRDLLPDGHGGAWVALDYGGVIRVSSSPLRVVEVLQVPHGRARSLVPGADGRPVVTFGSPPSSPGPLPRTGPGTRIDPDGALVWLDGDAPSWRVQPGLTTRADQLLRVGDRLVASHGKDGVLSVAHAGALERFVHLDGAVGGAPLRADAEGVWVPLPQVGVEWVDPATGDRRTWRFTPGALDVWPGRPALAARGAFGVAWLHPDGTVEACQPGQPVDGWQLDADGTLQAVTAGVPQPFPPTR